jgi:4,5-dihydroxyphthalate decarboxylase
MAKNIHLTLACGDYEILRSLIQGSTNPEGVDLTILTGMDSTTRHWRFLRNNEFDIAELSGSSYLMTRDQGMPIDAIPVFPHRRFRHGFIFVNTSKGIKSPKDLVGKKVGVKSFQATAILWMKGILEHEYGVPHKQVDWFSDLDEDIEFERPKDLKLTRLPDTTSVEKELVEGRLDAVLHTDLIEPIVQKDERVARLFPDHRAEEIAFYKKTQMFPIMHVVGIRRSLVEQYPWLPINLYKAFNDSKAAGMKRMFNPRVVPLAWYTEYWEEERAMLGPDPWEYGLSEQNRKTLDAMIGYSHEQGLIKRRLSVDELFLDVSEGKKRGTFRV